MPSPSPSRLTQAQLQDKDLEMYLAVKRKALSRLEEALDQLERRGGDPLRGLAEIPVVEREAARALGYDPQRYAQVKEEVARLVAERSRREERARLEQELKKTQEELIHLREQTRDAAAREFLEAQLRVLERELARLDREEEQVEGGKEKEALLARFRVQMAQLDARQQRLERRIRQAWEMTRQRLPATPNAR